MIDQFVANNVLSETDDYLDNITISGKSKQQNDANPHKFIKAAKKSNLALNSDKCSFSVTSVGLLGCTVLNSDIRSDLKILRPLHELPLPCDMGSLHQALGMFLYYSHWIVNYSETAGPLVQTGSFPMSNAGKQALKDLTKQGVEESMVHSIAESILFVVEADASDFAIATTFNQARRPVAFFFSRKLCK